jgi:hypothetical protein
MLKGKELTAIAVELKRQLDTKRDFVVPTSILMMDALGRLARKPENKPIELTTRAHRQVAQHLDIPIGYYQRMQESAPELLASNVNRWLEASGRKNERRMLRTLDQKCRRAFSRH